MLPNGPAARGDTRLPRSCREDSNWIVRQARQALRVHGLVASGELVPGKRLFTASLEGEGGDGVGDEAETFLRWVWPQHGRQMVVRHTEDERRRSRRNGRCVERFEVVENGPDDELHRLGVDEVEGAEAQSGVGNQRGSEVGHPDRGDGVVTRKVPYLARQLSGFVTADK